MGQGHETGPVRLGYSTPAGIHSLTDELLATIIKALYDSTRHEPEKGPAGSSLLPLRGVSHAFRDAVDTNIRASGIRVISKNGRNGALLVRVQDAIQARLPHWPNLRELRFIFDWKSDYLLVALLSIARACPLLHTLKLEYQPGTSTASERDDEPCLEPLAALPSLRKLVLIRFGAFPHWSAGLSLLSHLTMLELHSPGDVTLSPLPSLEQLDIQGHQDGTQPAFGLENLTQSTRLRDVKLSHMAIQSLPLSCLLATLQKLSLVGIGVEPARLVGGQQSGLHQLLGSDPSLLPSLNDLTLEDVQSLPQDLSLDACTALTSLFLVKLSRVRTLRPFNAPKLSRLVIAFVPQLEELPGLTPECFPCLYNLLLAGLRRLKQVSPMAGFLSLARLGLVNLRLVSSVPDLERLTSLSILSIVHCSSLIGEADISALHKLEVLSLQGRSLLQGNQLQLRLPEPANVPNLREMHLGHCVELPASFMMIGSLRNLASLSLTHIDNIRALLPGIRQLHSLTRLCIDGCIQLCGIQLDGLHSLKSLALRDFRLETTMPQLGHLVALTKLDIHDFPLLEAIPSLKGLRALETVTLSDCPNIQEADVRAGPRFRTAKTTNCASLEKVKIGLGVAVEFNGLPKLHCVEALATGD